MVDASGRPARRATARCRTASNPPSDSNSAAALTSAPRLRSPLGVTAAVTNTHAASNPAHAGRFQIITHGSQSSAHFSAFCRRGGKMAPMPDLSRRTVLRLSVGAAAGAAGAYALGGLVDPRPSIARTPVAMAASGAPLAPPAPLDPVPAAAAAPTMVTGSFVSAARGGVPTNWAIARPPGQTEPLRPVIALHGKGSDAATVMAGGVEQGLAQAVAAGLPPFAVVAVDGGGSYWHKRASGEDSGAMVLDELIPMLDVAGPGHLTGGVPGLVDGRLRRAAAGRPARAGPYRRDLRGEPRAVAVVGGDRAGRVRRRRRLRRQLRVRPARARRRSRSASTSATATRSTRRRRRSSPNCRIRRPAVPRRAGTTAPTGVRSCRPNSSWIAPLLTA